MLTFTAALLTQLLCLRLNGLKLQHYGVLSAIITAFGLSLLLRADNLWLHPTAAALSIASKFTIRYRFIRRIGESRQSIHGHLFNPAGLGCAVGAYLLGGWLSPGQWGQAVALAAWFVIPGLLVTGQAGRWDVALFFLGTYFVLYAGRTLYLGINPWVILHQAQNGALLLFAFFMLSDPMTTPRKAQARWLFGVLVAVAAFLWEVQTFKPNGAILALMALTALTPVFNWWWPDAVYRWKRHSDTA